MRASLALPERPAGIAVNRGATALGAVGLAVVIRPANGLEGFADFLIRHTRNGAQRERPGGCGKEEVLRHLPYVQGTLHI